MAAGVEVVDFDSALQEDAQPIDVLAKESAEQDDSKPSTLAPETADSDKSEPEPTSKEADEFASIQQHSETIPVLEASGPEYVQQDAAASIVDDNDIHEHSKDESESPIQSTEIEIVTSTDAPEIPERSPDRLIVTPERSPDRLVTTPERSPDRLIATPERSPHRLTATSAHASSIASVEEPISDNLLQEPQETSAESEAREIKSLPSLEPVSDDVASSDKPGAELSEKTVEHSATSDVQATVSDQFLSNAVAAVSEDAETTHEVAASKEEKLDEEPEKIKSDHPSEILQQTTQRDDLQTESTVEAERAVPAKKNKEKGKKGKKSKNESVQELPLLTVEDNTESDKKVETVESQGELEESATKEAPSKSTPVTIVEIEAKTAPSILPLTAAKEDTNGDLKHIFVSREAEEEPVDHNDGEQPRTEGITTVTKDDEKVKQKETQTKEDESLILADKAAHILENIKEAI